MTIKIYRTVWPNNRQSLTVKLKGHFLLTCKQHLLSYLANQMPFFMHMRCHSDFPGLSLPSASVEYFIVLLISLLFIKLYIYGYSYLKAYQPWVSLFSFKVSTLWVTVFTTLKELSLCLPVCGKSLLLSLHIWTIPTIWCTFLNRLQAENVGSEKLLLH